MKPKTTLILLTVAAIMFAFIWFKERQLPSTEDRSSRAKRVFDVKSDDLTKLQIQLNTSNYVGRIVVEKEKDKWLLREPLAYRASSSEISSICSELEFLDTDASDRSESHAPPCRGRAPCAGRAHVTPILPAGRPMETRAGISWRR